MPKGYFRDAGYRLNPSYNICFYDVNNFFIGVVLSHSNILAQTTSMIQAWEWSSGDTILHTLPLNHVHGVINGLLTPLQCGAR